MRKLRVFAPPLYCSVDMHARTVRRSAARSARRTGPEIVSDRRPRRRRRPAGAGALRLRGRGAGAARPARLGRGRARRARPRRAGARGHRDAPRGVSRGCAFDGARARIGLIGGSGVYDLSAIDGLREERLDTPFGSPVGRLLHGHARRASRWRSCPATAGGTASRPSEINYRANVCGFKMLGCDALLSASACGSLREELAPRQAVIPDQFIDRTRHREDTFFGERRRGARGPRRPGLPVARGVAGGRRPGAGA